MTCLLRLVEYSQEGDANHTERSALKRVSLNILMASRFGVVAAALHDGKDGEEEIGTLEGFTASFDFG